MTNEELWKAVLGQIELSISKANFITWFKNTLILNNQDGVITIGVPNGFAKEWLENKYNLYILRALKSFDENIKTIHCVIAPERASMVPSGDSLKNVDAIKPPESAGFVRKKLIEKPFFPRHWVSRAGVPRNQPQRPLHFRKLHCGGKQ